MAKAGKRYRAQSDKVEPLKHYELEDACDIAVSTASAKFDESLDIALRLGVDPRKADQNVRGSVSLPHGLGKEIRIAVFARGEKAAEAEAAGADIIGAEDLVEKIKGGEIEFDSVIATPDMMAQVGKIGKILGPRGLMPSPKVGTVTFDVGATVKEIKQGRAEYRVEKNGILHVQVGKASFGKDKLADNIRTLISAVNKAKPSTSKGVFLESASMSLTMGPGVKFDISPYRSI